MKASRTLIAAAVLCVAGMAPALAQTNALQNADFSAGLTAWDTFGDVTVLGPTKRAVLSTASTFDDDDGLGAGFNNNSGTTAVDLAYVADLGGVSVPALDAISGFAAEGSAIRQSFSATAGDLVTVSFTWAFLSLEEVANDFAFVALNDSVVKFADATTAPATSVFTGTFGDFNNVTWNWNTNSFSYVANGNGIQSFALGVVDAGDYALTSELRVDNLSIQVTPVPEPESYAMLLAGLAVMGSIARRRRPS